MFLGRKYTPEESLILFYPDVIYSLPFFFYFFVLKEKCCLFSLQLSKLNSRKKGI